MDHNPYRSPVASQRGEHDHRLFWMLVKIAWVFAIVFGLVDCFVVSRWGNLHSPVGGSLEVLRHAAVEEFDRLIR